MKDLDEEICGRGRQGGAWRSLYLATCELSELFGALVEIHDDRPGGNPARSAFLGSSWPHRAMSFFPGGEQDSLDWDGLMACQTRAGWRISLWLDKTGSRFSHGGREILVSMVCRVLLT